MTKLFEVLLAIALVSMLLEHERRVIESRLRRLPELQLMEGGGGRIDGGRHPDAESPAGPPTSR
jgi:hypothetical protein